MIFITDDDVVLETVPKEDCKVAILIRRQGVLKVLLSLW